MSFNGKDDVLTNQQRAIDRNARISFSDAEIGATTFRGKHYHSDDSFDNLTGTISIEVRDGTILIITIEWDEETVERLASAGEDTDTAAPAEFTLQFFVSPRGSGVISHSSGNYPSGTMLYITATPSEGYRFVSWSGNVPVDVILSPDIWILIDQDRTIQANFAPLSTTTSPPLAPSDLNADALSSSSIRLTWVDNSDNEENFKILRSQSSTGDFSVIGTVRPGVTSFDDTGLNASTTYYYWVQANNNAGYTGTPVVSATTYPSDTRPPVDQPPAPPMLYAQALSSDTIRLTWRIFPTSETGFRIERSLSESGSFVQIDTVGPRVFTYDDTGLNANTTYYYRIIVDDDDSDIPPSVVASATTHPATPSTFTLTVMKSGMGSGRVSGPGIDCGTDCTEEYNAGTLVTLSATDDSGSSFISWSGCDSSFGTSCNVIMDQNKMVTATFNLSFSTSIVITSLPASDDDGNYTLKWSVSGLGASFYRIEEDSNPSFSNPAQYSVIGGGLSYSFSGKVDGTYYYRVGMNRGGNWLWSEAKSITVARPSSSILRIENNTRYIMVDIQLNGQQMVYYPYHIPVGEYYDFVFDSPGTVHCYLGVGFYDWNQNRDVWFFYQERTTLSTGQTTTVTFNNPTIGQLLSGFNQGGRDYTGQYYCYSCPLVLNYKKFHFGYDGGWKLYEMDVNNTWRQVDSGSTILTSWPNYSFSVSFKIYPLGEEIVIWYPFEQFYYSNGPAEHPIIQYIGQF